MLQITMLAKQQSHRAENIYIYTHTHTHTHRENTQLRTIQQPELKTSKSQLKSFNQTGGGQESCFHLRSGMLNILSHNGQIR